MSSDARPTMGSTTVRVGLCQLPVSADKDQNLSTAKSYLNRAKEAGVNLAVLPECFNCPYDTKVFAKYAEPLPGESTKELSQQQRDIAPTLAMLRDSAIETGMYIVGGSIPESDENGAIYNTSLSFAPTGEIVGKHRKVHLFDVDVPGGIRFKESDALSPGQKSTTFSAVPGSDGIGDLCVGVGICYDIRFPDLSMSMVRSNGVHLLVFPGAFNMTTGPAHWELLARARAVDNQVYVAVCSPARWDESAGYTPWGHSSVVDPWGKVVATTDHTEGLVVADIDMARIQEVRTAIPTSKQRRPEVYD